MDSVQSWFHWVIPYNCICLPFYFFHIILILSFLLILRIFLVNFVDFSSSTQTLNMEQLLRCLLPLSHFTLCPQVTLSRPWLATFWWCEILYLYFRSLFRVLEQHSQLLVDVITWMYRGILKLTIHLLIVSPYTLYIVSYFWSSLRTYLFI